MKRKPNAINFFDPLETPVANPYIGFTSYQRFRGDPLYSDIVVRPENNGTETEAVECYPVPQSVPQEGDAQGFYPNTETAYFRILWKEFEPRRKEYDFDLIADVLAKAKAKGQTVIFRLMPHSTRASDDVPEWLKSIIPCPERPDGMRVKDSPKDPLYLRYFGEAIRAIAERFDDDPTLDAVDVSLTGAWGEGHLWREYPVSALKELVDVYTHAFRKTLLIGQCAAPSLVKYAAKTKPCGWRGDGVGEKKHITVFYPRVNKRLKNVWKTAPVSFESYWWLGEWERRGWNLDEIIEKTLSWHVSTFNAKSLPIPLQWRDKIAYWISKMGYHFLLDSFEYPDCAQGGDVLRCRLRGTNRGVAPIYRVLPLRIVLRNEHSSYLLDTDVDVRKWFPGKIKNDFDLRLPTDIAAGEYEMAITLSDGGAPVVRFESQGEWDGASLTVGKVTILAGEISEKERTERRRKAYLDRFLRDFGYPNEAITALDSAARAFFANEKSVALFENFRKRFEKHPDLRSSVLKAELDHIADLGETNRDTVYLLLLILLSEADRKVYADRGFSQKAWRDNMTDLKYTCDLCLPMKGVYGTYCPEWYAAFFAAKRFTFGRLQFERGRLGKTYRNGTFSLSPDDEVIYIHIPRTGERLLPADADASCAAASAFFRERFGIRRIVFACHSWLLYPENKKILPEGSNLYSFIARFDVVSVEEDTTYGDVWRLFDKEYDGDPNALPQDTSLRRAYAQRIRNGEPLGLALGVWVYDE